VDPNATLRAVLAKVDTILTAAEEGDSFEDDDAILLAEAVQSLHEWLTGGGSLPDAWG